MKMNINEWNIKHWITIFVCLTCLMFVGFGIQPKLVNAAGNTYYVAKSGLDSNPGTFAQPWLTITKAAKTMVAGDTVNIEAGTYNEMVTPANSGSAGNWITYQNYNGQSVIIDGTGISTAYTGIFRIPNRNYITVKGLTIQNATGDLGAAGVYVYGACNYVTLQNLTVYNTELSGIWAGSSWSYITPQTMTNLLIDGCTVHHTNIAQNQEGISLNCISNFEVKNCTLYDMVYPAGAGICSKAGTNNGSIHNNEVYNCPNTPLIYIGYAASNISIYDNKVHDVGGTGHGITLADEQGVSSLRNINIYNNLIYNNYRGFVVAKYGTETYNFSFINNTLYNNGANTEIFIVPTHTQLSSCIIRNNIIYSLKSNTFGILYSDYANGGITVDHNLFYNSGGAWHSGNVLGNSYVTGNPLLTNPMSDFSLQSGSPAIDAGSSTGAPYTDYIGNIRPHGAEYDIGVYELGTSTTSTAPSTSTTSTTLIIRPNNNGDIIQLTSLSGLANYKNVLGSTADDGIFNYDYSESPPTTKYDLYALSNHTTQTGEISYIKIYARCAGYPNTSNVAMMKIKTGGTEFNSTSVGLSSTYANYSYTWSTNPKTGAAWTWADIDALQAGISFTVNTAYQAARCTQLYVEVGYLQQ